MDDEDNMTHMAEETNVKDREKTPRILTNISADLLKRLKKREQ